MWYLDRITSRSLPSPEYKPLYTGKNFTVNIPEYLDDHSVQILYQVSPEIQIKFYKNSENLLSKKSDRLSALLIAPHDYMCHENIFQKHNLLPVIPSGESGVGIDGFPNCLVVGASTALDKVSYKNNHGNIDIYAPGDNSLQASYMVLASLGHFHQTGQSNTPEELRNHVLTSATQNTLWGVWPPYDPEIEYLHNTHENNRLLHVPTSDTPMLWNTAEDFGVYFFIKKYRPKIFHLNTHYTVREIKPVLVDLPSFVTLHDNKIMVNNWCPGIQPGIYRFVLRAYAHDVHQDQTFYIKIMDFENQSLDQEYSYVFINGQYHEVEQGLSFNL